MTNVKGKLAFPNKQSQRKEYEQLGYFIKRPKVIDALHRKGIKHFFPIQYQTFDAINFGSDLIGKDRTGSGKTIAYALPILQRFRDLQILHKLNARPKFLIILPTRQLAIQVKNEIETLKISQNEFNVIAVYGGSPMGQQKDAIRRGVDVIAATPGRLLDLLSQGCIDMAQLQTICLDEADQMLKQGFQEDIQKILEFIGKYSPMRTQKLLFSATLPKWVEQLASNFMSKHRKFIDLVKTFQIKTSKTIEHLRLCLRKDKRTISQTIRKLIAIYAGAQGSIIIFCETKREANDLYGTLDLPQAKAILHGDIAQFNRETVFRQFKQGIVRCLVATNVAARGLDIPSVDFIIQMEPPKKADEYVHRAGRTGRAGKNGVCLTFYERGEKYLLSQIQKMASIRFREIGEPRQSQIFKAKTQQVLNRLRNMDIRVTSHFEEAAKDLINQLGSVNALAFALADITGMKDIPQQLSMQTNSPGFLTYIFSTEGERVSQKQMHEFFSNRVERYNQSDVSQINFLSDRAIAFDVPEGYKSKLFNLIKELDKSENFLLNPYRLTLVTNAQMLQNSPQNNLEYTHDEYENAIRHSNQWQVYVRGFGMDVNQDTLIYFFRNNGVKAIQAKLPRGDNDLNLGYGFVLCINQQQKDKALSLSNQLTLQNKRITIDQKKQQQRR